MKEMLRNCHGHNLSKGNTIKIFYHGLSKITQEVLNAAAGGIFLYKTPNQAYQLLEDKFLLKLDWAKNQKTKSSLKKTVSFADEGRSNTNTDKIMARMDAMTIKIDAQYKELQYQAKQPTPNLGDDEMPMSREEEAKFMKTFLNFDSDDEDDEPTPQPKTQPTKPVKETPLPKPYKPKIPYPQRLRKEKMKAQYGKFLDMIRAVRINVPLVDVLAGMPNYGKFLKELISNKHKIEQIFDAFLSDESSAMIQNKVPPKLEDPGSFLSPSDRSFQYPVGIAKNMLVEVGKFTFPADFGIFEMEEDSKVPLIFGRPFLYTADVVIRVKQKQLNLGVRTERMIFNINSAMKHSYSNDDTCFSIDVIDEILEEDFDALLDEGSKILYSIEGTLLEEEIFSEFDEFMAMNVDEGSESESDTKEPPFEKITINIDYKNKTSLEEPPTDLKLKTLLDNLEYVFLEEPSFLPVIISSKFLLKTKTNLYPSLKNIKKPLLGKQQTFLRCKDAHLVLNWEKCHFMAKEGIVLGHKVSGAGLEVDKAKINVISKLPPFTNIKVLEAFLDMPVFIDVSLKISQKLPDLQLSCLKKIFHLNSMMNDRKGTENVAADHLSRIVNEESSDDSKIDDNFLGETLMEVNTGNEPSVVEMKMKVVGGDDAGSVVGVPWSGGGTWWGGTKVVRWR
nr:reverse transcriptase domain-containing protein [Tanacetum cinerariifolium]